MDNYPEANERHYAFMLEGLRDVAADLVERQIKFIVRHGQPADAAIHFGKEAALIVCDTGYTRHQRRWRDDVADRAKCEVVEVESDVVIPVETVSDKQEYAARTIRTKIHRHWEEYLKPLHATKLKYSSLRLHVNGDIDVTNPSAALAKLKLDRSVAQSRFYTGGSHVASAKLKSFIASKNGITGYDDGRNEPAAAHTSHMSMHLQFGQISPIELALAVRNSDAPTADREAYLEELIVRRELAVNFVHFCPKYDSYACLPDWARKTLAQHARDRRPVTYTRKQLESAETHDEYWNAAQREMLLTGFMHNYMRMYWGKKILEWRKDPQEAYETTLALNNKYFIDGRSPNAFANVGWIYGLHDRPWGSRPIFGTVRYMNAAGLKRKFDMDAYVKKIAAL